MAFSRRSVLWSSVAGLLGGTLFRGSTAQAQTAGGGGSPLTAARRRSVDQRCHLRRQQLPWRRKAV